MTIAVDMGRKATKTKKNFYASICGLLADFTITLNHVNRLTMILLYRTGINTDRRIIHTKLGITERNPVFCSFQTTKAHISLRICVD